MRTFCLPGTPRERWPLLWTKGAGCSGSRSIAIVRRFWSCCSISGSIRTPVCAWVAVDEMAFTWGMPLYECARHGKHAMAEMLLRRGADPNAQVYASGTPLSEAFGQRDEKMIALLERYGGKSNPSMAGFYRRNGPPLRLLGGQWEG